MIFSPTTERSFSVRSLYAAIYGFLILGAITMIVPFVIMATGSVEPRAQATDGMFFPAYLVDREVLWERYLETKYHGLDEFFRSSWNLPDATFAEAASGDTSADESAVALWKRFQEETQPPTRLFAAGFLRPNARMPSTNAFAFREWLLARHGSLDGINKALDTAFPVPTQIRPPFIRFDGAPLPSTPLVRAFEEFLATLPDSRRFAWNVGGYYRTNVLPRLIGPLIEDYNSKFGTSYSSYAEVPFPSTMPAIGGEPWFFFTSQLLRPDFIALTPSGEKRRAELGLEREDFIRSQAIPEDLRIVSADTLFADWATSQGIADARIPQPQIDRADFDSESGFWRNQFLTLNYRLVLDEILINGPAIRNTLILVLLSVGGSLLINPLAAYALSRYKMRSSFHILLFFLATIAFPAEVTMIPVFLQLKEFNLLNTFGALVLPGLANGFSIFLLKGFFDSLPRELYEAAELDGAGEWTMFWTVTMNLSKPILAVIALGAFVNAYGTFFYALILAPDPKMWTIMVYVYQLRQAVDPPVVYASLLITAIPTMIIFVTCQNIILRGIVVPSEK
jgi:multiple sugar transport system permease protein